MAKKANQKKKLLLLMRYFQEETDREHPTTIIKLIDMLEQEEISAERKSLYDDIAILREWGMPLKIGVGSTICGKTPLLCRN